MEMSATIAALAEALAKAQAEIEGAVKGSVNPHFRSRYADLGAVWDAVREPLTKHGLSVVQGLSSEAGGGYVSCKTMLLHSSGEWIASTFTVPVGKMDAQGFGSAATYARRYSLQGITGIAPVDDDANDASRRPTNSSHTSEPGPTDMMPRAKQKAAESAGAELPNAMSQEHTHEKEGEEPADGSGVMVPLLQEGAKKTLLAAMARAGKTEQWLADEFSVTTSTMPFSLFSTVMAALRK
jgi:hypothetical protein